MKFWEIFRFEFTYQIRRPWPWLIVIMLMVLAFLFMRDGSFSEALYTEFFINSPFMVAMATVFGSLLWLLTGAFIAGEAASRDIATGMHALTYTVPISKAQYLGGKFLAAFFLNALILLFVQVTIILAVYLPGVHPDSIGPFRPAAFVTAYCFIALPNAFAASAIQFAFGTGSGRPMTAYIGSLALFFTAFFIASLILFRSGMGTLLDPIGVRFIWDELSHLWTTVEKSHRLLELKGTLLQNRLVWIGIGFISVTLTYLTFAFKHRIPTKKWWGEFKFQNSILQRDARRLKIEKAGSATSGIDRSHPGTLNPESGIYSFGFREHCRQILTISWNAFKSLAMSWAGFAMLILIPLMAIPVVVDQMYAISIPLIPTAARVMRELTGPLSADLSRWMVIPGFIIYFAGELIWQERDHGVSDITDSMPGSEWAPVIGKFLAITLMLFVFTLTLTAAGMLAQMLMGYTPESYLHEIGLYIKIMFGLQLPEYLLFTVLALFVHTLVNQKYVGHLVAIIAYAFIAAIATMLGVEHNLLIYGAGPNWTYTEIREFGPFLGPWLWFKLYWAAWALLLTVLAMLFWVRGKENGFRFRLQSARHRFTGSTTTACSVAVILILVLGGFIFYNTNILNTYRNSTQVGEWRARYEHRYGRFENVLQPSIARTKLNVDIYPERYGVTIHGSYYLVNKGDVAIDSIHVSTSTGNVVTRSISFDKTVTLAVDDEEYRYRIYTLDPPLHPGDSLRLDFEVDSEQHGFGNRGIDPSIVEEGSYFTNEGLFPAIGFQRTRGIINPAERRQYGLSPRPVLDALSEAHDGESISLGGGTMFEAVISTNDNQLGVAPGALDLTWVQNGRRYAQYKTSAPIGSEWAFFSAQYLIFEKTWISNISHKPVVVRIFHHPKHSANVQNMMRGVISALEYYSEQFGTYPYSHLNIVEHPAGPGTGMHADASMISYGQGYGDWIPENEHTLDFPFAVMGHEMGHQWSLPYAYVEGLPFLAEGLAWYYGMMLVKETRGPEQARRLLTFMRQPYPHQPIRRGEPLMRALDPYLAYKRGPLAMYALSEYAGSDRVNSALRRLNEKSDSVGASRVTTVDLYHELQSITPDSLQSLLREFFEVNTLWELETSGVTAVRAGGDKWKVTIRVKATKIVYDSAGVETGLPMNDWIPIGVFAAPKPGFDELSSPLYLQKHNIRSGEQIIEVFVTGMPTLAGIDPHHLLDWEEKEDDDNIAAVVIKAEDGSTGR
jgi:ABC-2 type transport system permease protein